MTTLRAECPSDVLLLSFSDGVLLPLDAERVQAHLAHCVACAGQVARLRESLGFAQEHWRRGATRAASGGMPRERPPARLPGSRRSLQHVRAALMGLAAGLATWTWLPSGAATGTAPMESASIPLATVANDDALRVPEPVTSGPSLDELLAQVELAGAAGRALAVAELLLEESAPRELVRAQLEFVISHYPAAPAALRARTLLRNNWEVRG